MASITQLNADSDSENDSDFIPDDAADSDSGSDASGRSAKRKKLELDEQVDQATKDAEKEARASAWAQFQAKAASASSKPAETDSTPIKMIKIEKRYRFAGEEVINTVEVPEDSAEAKAWLAAQVATKTDEPTPQPQSPLPAASASSPEPTSSTTPPAASVDAELTPAPTCTISAVTDHRGASPETPTILHPIPKPLDVPQRVDSSSSLSGHTAKLSVKPGPVHKTKPKGGGFGALLKGKPKKLSTLEKSRLDWSAHVDSAGADMKDELEANRRSGGYIEKMEFLGRVGERLDETLDNAKGGKRKR